MALLLFRVRHNAGHCDHGRMRTVTENSNTRHGAEPDEPHEPSDDREEMDDYQWILDGEDQTPEEEGYGHGV